REITSKNDVNILLFFISFFMLFYIFFGFFFCLWCVCAGVTATFVYFLFNNRACIKFDKPSFTYHYSLLCFWYDRHSFLLCMYPDRTYRIEQYISIIFEIFLECVQQCLYYIFCFCCTQSVFFAEFFRKS